MTNKNKPNRMYVVGEKLKVKLHDGRIVDATVRAIVDDSGKLQIDFGNEETALIKASQVVNS
jgi:molybdopterin-binding protein